MASFSNWLYDEMQQRRILSIHRLAMEAGLDPLRVSDWIMDRGRPQPDEAQLLAWYFSVPVEQVKDRVGLLR